MAETIDITACDQLVGNAVDVAVRAIATYYDEHEHTRGTESAYVKRHRTLENDPDQARKTGDNVRATLVYRFTVGVSDAAARTTPKQLYTIVKLLKQAVAQQTLVEAVGPGDIPHHLIIGPVQVTPYDAEHGQYTVSAVTFTARVIRAGLPA